MLATAAFALSLVSPAAACSPIAPMVEAMSPMPGAVDVPVDAVVQLKLAGGSIVEPDLTVWVDGEPITGDIQMWGHADSGHTVTGLATFRPKLPLPVNALVEVILGDSVGEGGAQSWTFETGAGDSALLGANGPEIGWVDSWVATEESECTNGPVEVRQRDVELWGDAPRNDLSWMVVFRAEPGAESVDPRIDLPLVAIGPISDLEMGDMDEAEMFSAPSVEDTDLGPEDVCTYAVIVGPDGSLSQPSAVVCSQPIDWMCGTTSCSTGALQATVAPALLGLLGAGLRRRRRDEIA